MDAPFVLQCAGCRRVVSDSNQLVCTVSALDVLVLDAIVGVRIDQPEHAQEQAAAVLSCSECQAQLGHVYSRVEPELSAVLSQPSAPRYAMQRHALASYVFGSAKTQHDIALALESHDKPNDASDDASSIETSVAHEKDLGTINDEAVSLARARTTGVQIRANGPMDPGADPGKPSQANIHAIVKLVRAEVRDELRTLSERVSLLEATRRQGSKEAAPGQEPFKDEGARQRLNQLTRALLSLDGRVEAVEDRRTEVRDSVWGELLSSKEPSPSKYESDRKRARAMAAPQYV